MIYTKEIVKDKFWIIENSGIKIGTIRFCSSDDFVVNVKNTDISSGINNEHVTHSELIQCFGEKILEAKESPIVESNPLSERKALKTSLGIVEDYPSKHVPYNTETIELKGKQIPTYTKTETSKVRYAAGYYGVRFAVDWRWFYGGKLDTLNTYEFIGPFKTKSEMQNETKLAIKRDGL